MLTIVIGGRDVVRAPGSEAGVTESRLLQWGMVGIAPAIVIARITLSPVDGPDVMDHRIAGMRFRRRYPFSSANCDDPLIPSVPVKRA